MERKHVAALFVACVVGAVAGKIYVDRKNAPATVELAAPQWTLAQAIDEAGDYMTRVCDDKGRFVYTMAVDGVHVKPSRYNVVRHAGAIYALADIQVQASEAKRGPAQAAATRAAENLVRTYIRPPTDHPDMMAVWSDPKEEGGGNKMTAKLGGTGLGLIGLMGRYRAFDGGPEAGDLGVMRGLAKFIVFLQKPSGDFVSKFTNENGKSTDFESLYYPGEAMLGMTMLYEADRDPQWLTTAAKGIAYLVASRKNTAPSKLPADHWLMIAIDRFLPFYGDLKEPPIPKNDILQHAIDLGKMMMEGQVSTAEKHPDIDGCYTSDGRTTPSATRLEGLLALEHALAADPGANADFRKEVRASIVKGIQFLRRSQHVTGPVKGGFPQAVVVAGDHENKPARDDSEDDRPGDHRGEVRIDYAQHAVSALMRYRQMCNADATGCVLP